MINVTLQKLVSLAADDPVREIYSEEKYGGYNDAPPNWREITMEEFARSEWFTYSPVAYEHRQFIIPDLEGKDIYHSVAMFYMQGGSGFAFTNEYWENKVRIFRFDLCVHDYHGLSQEECRKRGIYHAGMCYHVMECAKCGQIYAYDSSD
jgi:hypothetical protein